MSDIAEKIDNLINETVGDYQPTVKGDTGEELLIELHQGIVEIIVSDLEDILVKQIKLVGGANTVTNVVADKLAEVRGDK